MEFPIVKDTTPNMVNPRLYLSLIHISYMLETIDIKSVYLINVDYQGNKEAKCLDKYPRIKGTNNPRIMYLKGLFGGVPIVDILDYDTILQELDDSSDVEGGE